MTTKEKSQKTATERAIEDAIGGGFYSRVAEEYLEDWAKYNTLTVHDYGWIFIDQTFWQALGKQRGWSEVDKVDMVLRYIQSGKERTLEKNTIKPWQYKMHRFIDLLAEGLSINQALEAIE